MTSNNEKKLLTKSDINKVFWRSFTVNASFNYERQMSQGAQYALSPILQKLYPDKKELGEALQRHAEFFNTTPMLCPFIFGITAAMEEENATQEDFDPNTINSVKAGLMGPLAGIGDSVFWGTLRPLAGGIACSLALTGNLFAPFLFLLLFNIPNVLVRYFGCHWGYNSGMKALNRFEELGLTEKIFTAAAIIGLLVIGGMSASMVSINPVVAIGSGDNAIKLIGRSGEKMDEDTIALIEDYLDGRLEVFGQMWQQIPLAKREHIGRTVDYTAGRNRYVGYLISLGMFSFKGMKVGLDCANGSAWTIAKSVFDALGAKTYVMGDEPDGFNINNGVGSTHIDALRRFVVANGLDIGFAYDGDADRCLAVDEQGTVITGDHILYVCGKHLKQEGELPRNTVVTTIMSNFGLYRAFDREGIAYAKTAVGDKYVYEYMAKNGCALGGEQSGHIIFSKYASTGDGVLTSLKLMEVMLERKLPMSKLLEGLTIYPQVLENIRVKDKKAAREDSDVQAAVETVAARLGETGRILVRESGTEPVLRVMAEAPEDAVCRECVAQVAEVIRRKGHCVS